MNYANLIAQKRDGGELSRRQIEDVVANYVNGEMPDYQMAALAMAIFFQGMSHQETVDLTRAMRDSGRVLDWAGLRPIGDKHSTGGVGDKISLALVPAVAACGLHLPKISGRGLGPTGGTLDKLQSIPGFRTELSIAEMQQIVRTVGCCITGTTGDLAPADKKLYALRDVTGTVPSMPLIAASILSKKLAEGLDALVIDVKWGSGAFMRTLPQARALAQTIVAVANDLGVPTTAVLSDMNQPLGRAVGNTIEVGEALETLAGAGPPDVRDIVLTLGAQLLVDARSCPDLATGQQRIAAALANGQARAKFEAMVAAQGGRLAERVPVAAAQDFFAADSGFVRRFDCEKIGQALIELGGGRRKLGDAIDPAVGIHLHAKIGEWTGPGQPLLAVHCRGEIPAAVAELLQDAIELSETPYIADDLIVETFAPPDLRP